MESSNEQSTIPHNRLIASLTSMALDLFISIRWAYIVPYIGHIPYTGEEDTKGIMV